MLPFARRCIAYGVALPVAAALCYAGFVYEAPPDPEHAITQAEIKLRFAARLPAQKRDGSAVPAREALIADAVRFIDEAERLAPASARTVEYRAYVEYLRGDVRAAAAGYARARGMAAAGEERSELALSEARMLVLAGDDRAALTLLEGNRAGLTAASLAVIELERGRILCRQHEPARALAAAQAVLDCTSATGEALIGTGHLLEDLEHDDIAAVAYTRAAKTLPLATYYGARLKARKGDVDNALGMLECAVKDAGTTVRALIERDPAVWAPCSRTERFRNLFPDMEAAQPGR